MTSPLLQLRVLATAIVFASLVLLAACGGGSTSVGAGSGNAGPVMATLTASPGTINSGQTSTLTWTTTNATSAMIDNGVGSVMIGSGSQTVTPTQTTSYTITATGANGQQATAQTTVTVNAVAIADEHSARHLHAPGEPQL